MFRMMRCSYRALVALVNGEAFTMAAAIAYYGLFSLFPMLILILTLIGRTFHGSELEAKLIDSVIQWIPSGPESTVIREIRQLGERDAGALTLLGALGMAWSGSAVFGVLRESIYAAYKMKPARSMLDRKLADIALILAVGVFFVLSIASSASLSVIRKITDDFTTVHHYPVLTHIFGESGLAWSIMSSVVPFLVSLVAFFLAYWVIPLFRIPARHILPAALLASVLFELAKRGFGWYLSNFSKYDIVFGSLGTVVAFLFWAYVAAIILIFGAEFASQVYATRRCK